MRLTADLADMPIISTNTEDRLLHEQELPVQLIYPNREWEERTAALVIRIKSRTDTSRKTSTFVAEILDDQDPLFLYTISVSEEEFPQLKQELSLLIDFSQLHIHVIDILQRIKVQSSRYTSRLILNTSTSPQNSAEFFFCETSDFRRIDHLKFRAVQATDNILKQHLSRNIKTLKTRCSTLQAECEEYQNSLIRKESDLSRLKSDLDNSSRNFEIQRNSLTLEFTEKLAQAKEEAARQQRKAEIEFDEEKKSLEADYRKQLATFTSKLESAQLQLQELSQTNFNLKHSLEKLQSEHSSQTQELEHSLAERSRLKESKESLDHQVLNLEKEKGQLTARVASLEQQLTDKESLCQKVQSLLDATNEQKMHLEQSITVLKNGAQKDERRLNECIKEIQKGNQIIQALQSELKSAKSKVKLKGTVVVQQEAILEKSKHDIEALNRSVSELRSEISRLQSELQAKDAETAQAKKALEESKDTVNKQNGMITMLNNQLQEKEAASKVSSRIPALQSRPYSSIPSFQKSFDGTSSFSHLSNTSPSKLDYNASSVTSPVRYPYQTNPIQQSAFFSSTPTGSASIR